MRHRLRYVRNAIDGNGTLFRGDKYQVSILGLLGGSGQTIFEESITQKYSIGARLETPDGRVFRYCKAGAAIATSINGCANFNKPYEGNRPATAYAVGAKEIVITTISGGNTQSNTAKNAYQGGYIWFQMDPHMFHLIVSNTVSDGTNQILTLDRGLLHILPASASGSDTMWVTIWTSPYANVQKAAGGMVSVVCKPLINITSGYYFWGQTWGPAFFQAGGTAPGKTASYRTAVFATDGAVLDAASGAVGNQRAGDILSQTTSSDGDQLVMLRLAP